MKKIFVFLNLIILLISCNTLDTNSFIYENSKKFQEFEKSAIIKSKEAVLIKDNYLKKNQINVQNDNPHTFKLILRGIKMNHYVFTYYNNFSKIPENKFSLNGIWINCKTGKVKKVTGENKIYDSFDSDKSTTSE